MLMSLHPGRTRRDRFVRGFLAAVLLAAAALVAAEGFAYPSPWSGIVSVLSGWLVLAALTVPVGRTLAVLMPAALAASLALTGELMAMPAVDRPEVTFGLAEGALLVLLIIRCVRRLPLWTAWLPAIVSAAACLLIVWRVQERDSYLLVADGVLVPVLGLAVVVALYLRSVDVLRAREQEVRLQEQRLDYARELHDFVGHHITAIVAQTKALRHVTASGAELGPGELDERFADIERAGTQALESMRGMVAALRKPEGGPAVRPVGSLEGLRELAEAPVAPGVRTELNLDPALAARILPPETVVAAHRLVQESLTNIRKHAAGAGRVVVDVRLGRGPEPLLQISVRDDGSGPSTRTAGGGYGLTGLAERAEALGGTCTAGPGPIGGWIVDAELPLPAALAG